MYDDVYTHIALTDSEVNAQLDVIDALIDHYSRHSDTPHPYEETRQALRTLGWTGTEAHLMVTMAWDRSNGTITT